MLFAWKFLGRKNNGNAAPLKPSAKSLSVSMESSLADRVKLTLQSWLLKTLKSSNSEDKYKHAPS